MTKVSETMKSVEKEERKYSLSLRDRLAPEAAELYDYILALSPEPQNFITRMTRCPGEVPFRYLIRSVLEDTIKSTEWIKPPLSDAEIADLANDTENRISAWSLVMDGSESKFVSTLNRYWINRIANLQLVRGAAAFCVGIVLFFFV